MQSNPFFYHVSVIVGGRIICIKATDILFIEASDKFAKIVTREKSFLTKTTLSHLEEGLFPKFFCRVHRSYIVGIFNIALIFRQTILVGDHNIPLSPTYEAELFARLDILNS